jgi:hypothetical protein
MREKDYRVERMDRKIDRITKVNEKYLKSSILLLIKSS